MTGLDIEGVLRDHWPIPVFGCECTSTDDETGEKAVLETRWETHVASLLREQIGACLAPVHALADQWNETPDYTPSAYDQGRVDQRHDMTTQLLEALAALVAPSRVPEEET